MLYNYAKYSYTCILLCMIYIMLPINFIWYSYKKNVNKHYKWLILQLKNLNFTVLYIQLRQVLIIILHILNTHSDYEENVLRNQYCFIKSLLTWDDAKVRCVIYKIICISQLQIMFIYHAKLFPKNRFGSIIHISPYHLKFIKKKLKP